MGKKSTFWQVTDYWLNFTSEIVLYCFFFILFLHSITFERILSICRTPNGHWKPKAVTRNVRQPVVLPYTNVNYTHPVHRFFSPFCFSRSVCLLSFDRHKFEAKERKKNSYIGQRHSFIQLCTPTPKRTQIQFFCSIDFNFTPFHCILRYLKRTNLYHPCWMQNINLSKQKKKACC